MPVCEKCGEPIVFRYVGGRPTPIHTRGNWCRGYQENKSSTARGPFRGIASYVNPNATCPVCGKSVFYYRSPNGGRVFFDDLGWPWPKHPCTDSKARVKESTKKHGSGRNPYFRSRDGSQLALYDLDDFEETEDEYKFIFRRQDTNKRRSGFLKKRTLLKGGLKLEDFYDAPAFVVDLDKSGAEYLRVDFICGRLGNIIKIRMKKVKRD